MKEHLKNYYAAQAAANAATGKVAELTTKAESLRLSLAGLRASAAEKAAAKDRALDQFVKGESAQPDVDRARVANEFAQNALRDAEDILTATERVISELERDIPKLAGHASVAERTLWQTEAEQMRADILKAIGDKYWRYNAVKRMAGVYPGPDGFASDLFGPLYIERIQTLSKEIRRETLGKD